MTEFIGQAFSSLVLVVPSKDVEELAALNNVSFTELIKPFNKFRLAQYPTMFSLRFKALKDLVRATVKEAQDTTLGAVGSFDAKLADETNQTLTPEPTPWFKAYEQEFLGLVRASDHEFFNHPQACLSVVSSKHTDPINWLEQSFSLQNPPRPFSAQQMDTNILRHYLVVHDGADPDKTQAETILTQMKQKFGEKNCQMLIINSFEGTKAADDTMHSVWSSLRRTQQKVKEKEKEKEKEKGKGITEPSEEVANGNEETGTKTKTNAVIEEDESKASEPASEDPLQQASAKPGLSQDTLGCRMAPQDLDRLHGFVQFFGEKSFVPYLEGLEEKLETHIAQTKKSAYGAAKKWLGLGSSSQSKVPDSAATSGVSHLSMRMALRRLGDVVFTLQKYELAINTYHSLKKEYSHDKGFKERAGASEMEGISVYLQDQSRADNRYFDNAIMWYEKCNAQIYHCRAVLIAANIAVERRKFRDAAVQMMKSANSNNSSDLNSGLLLEQVAICNLKMRKGHQKRAAFFLMLAGHRFVKAGLKQNGLRVYTQGRKVYTNIGWTLAEDHLNFSIGRQSQHVDNYTGALESFTRLLRLDNNQQISQQQLYVNEFISSWKSVHAKDGEDADMAELPIPLIDEDSITLSMNDIDTATSDPVWNALEKPILIHARNKRSRVSSVSTFTRRSTLKKSPVAVAGEPLYFKVTLRNPLRIPIELRSVKLMAFVTDAEKKESTLSDITVVASVKIGAKGTATVELTATSSIAGQIKIKGIQFSLSGQVGGCRSFSGQGPRLNDSNPAKRGVVYGQDYRLCPLVIPPMPLLEGKIHNVPESFVSGSIFNSSLTLQNNSKATLFRLFIGCNKTTEDLLFHQNAFKGKVIHERSITILILDLPDGLPAGSSLTLPFSCQPSANASSSFDLMFMVYYEAQTPHHRQPYRMLKLDACTRVVPSLHVSTTVFRAPKSLDQRLFRVIATNVSPNSSSVALQSLVCNSKWWDVKCISHSSDTIPSQFTLGHGETVSFICQANLKDADSRDSSAIDKGEKSDEGATDGDAHHVIALAKQLSDDECSNVMTEQFLTRAVASDLNFSIVWECTTPPSKPTSKSNVMSGDSSVKSSRNSSRTASRRESEVDPVSPDKDTKVEVDGSESEESGLVSQVVVGHTMECIALTRSEPTRSAGGQVAGIEVGMRHQDSIAHDFTTSPFAVVDVDVIIQNCSAHPISVTVELLEDQPQGKSKQNSFTWIGKTTITHGVIEAANTVTLPISLAVMCTGVYDVNRIKVVAQSEHNNSAPACMVHQSLITVTQSV